MNCNTTHYRANSSSVPGDPKSAIICEGQIDMITCFEHGIDNIVAPLGTAFTTEHARLLKRHTEQVVLCFDSDNAGYKAAQSCFSELSKEGLFVRVATLPKGDDPDSLIRREGVESLRAHLERAKDFVDWQIDLRMPAVDPNNLRDRMRLLSDVAGSIAKLSDRMARDTAINRAAVRLTAPVDELRRMVTAHAKTMLKNKQTTAERQAHGGRKEDAEAAPVPVIDNPAVRQLLKLALTCSEARRWMSGEQAGAWLAFVGGELIARALQAGIDPARPETAAAWLSTLAAEEELLVTAVMHDNSRLGGTEDAQRAALSLQIDSVNSQIDTLTAQLRQPGLTCESALGLHARITALQKEKVDLQKRKQDIQLTR